MALTPSTMPELGSPAPDFALPDTAGNTVSLNNFADKPLLVAFWCNHCPYVLHINDAFVAFAREYQAKGLEIVAISANDVENYPQDAPDKMKVMAEQSGYTFPYLYDETQAIARAYAAACTPDFFMYDRNHQLVYCGRFDEARPGNDSAVTGSELRAAADALLADEP
ncbi:MAG: thioredoxin family protein, partial [Gammaproteobacteria bacterium]